MPDFAILDVPPPPKRRKKALDPDPFPCAICGADVPAHEALVQFGRHPGKREYWPRCRYHELRIAHHVKRIREVRAALNDAYASGLIDDE